MAAGRPTDFKPEYCELATNYCLLGATDSELADFLEISESTLNLWKQQHSEFSESIKAGKDKADSQVAKSLYQRALTNDTTAAIFWLKNRRTTRWRDRHEHTGADGGPVEFTVKSILEDK